MNKVICTLVTASVLVSGAAYGQSKSKTTHEKQALRDSQMDKVTAAGEENSSIAANNSTVTENNSGAVSLAGTALMGASGINIVNSTDALVANGVNIYDASLTADAKGTGTDVKQKNNISRTARRPPSQWLFTGNEQPVDAQQELQRTPTRTRTSSSINASLNHIDDQRASRSPTTARHDL